MEMQKELQNICEELSYYNSKSLPKPGWLKAEGYTQRYTTLPIYTYNSIEIPVLGKNLISTNQDLTSKYQIVTIEFSESITEILFINLNQSHFKKIIDNIFKISNSEGRALKKFIEKTSFKNQLKTYLKDTDNKIDCESELSKIWSQIYIEETLIAATMSATQVENIQLYGSGLAYQLHDGIVFVTIADDKNVLIKAVSYNK
ncbi:hypothetical protein PVT68_00610 [Microbulbifer bruguierae]|uniref:RES domain-containing protein n=1 Tax=Microbulbifer bruguierae TaxID=3029061 RepID=A0ABY8ND14_9GAMM|nr:hypothetical protein [Microbulbifer bruguierae]WGL16816.1 hypothetical protein PVT68_00610 [Microbulbifer bruguierae]